MFGENNEANTSSSVGRGNGEILFEGDIVTSIETIVEYYETTENELRSMYGGNQRAAASISIDGAIIGECHMNSVVILMQMEEKISWKQYTSRSS